MDSSRSVVHEAGDDDENRGARMRPMLSLASLTDSGAPTWLFPCYPCGACQDAAEYIFPPQLTAIQDYTHLVVLVGTVSSIALNVDNVWTLLFGNAEGQHCHEYCIRQVSFLFFLIPVTTYFIKLIMRYDRSLMRKQRAVQEEQQKTVQELEGQVDEMNKLLVHANDCTAILTERIFESRVRDFQRFLIDSKRYDAYFLGCKGSSDQLVKQFRTFILQWLSVYREWSIDPSSAPRIVVPEELERLNTVGEIGSLVDERLEEIEVKHISAERDQQQMQLGGVRRKSHAARKSLTTSLALGLQAVESHTAPPVDLEAGVRPKAPKRLRCGCRWLMCCGRRCCGDKHDADYLTEVDETGYPRTLRFGFGNIIVLSKEHYALISGFFFGIVVFLMFFVEIGRKQYRGRGQDVVEIVLTELCIIVVLMRFEQLDEFQRLKREAAFLKEQRLQAELRHESMNSYWEAVQQLTDLWVHRTVPQLSLYKEVHEHLIRGAEDELITLFAGANAELKDLVDSLGNLDSWRADGALDLQHKKKISNAITTLSSERTLANILVRTQDVKHLMRQLAIKD